MCNKKNINFRFKKSEEDLFKLLFTGIFILVLSAILTAKINTGFIQKNMAKLGFSITKISPISKGFYQVHVNKFHPCKALSLIGSFKPFYVNVKVQNGKIWLQRSTFIRKIFRINSKYLPFGIIMKEFQVPQEKLNQRTGYNFGTRLIFNTNLKCVKKYREDARVKISGIKSSAIWTINAINECPIMQCDIETQSIDNLSLLSKLLSQKLKISDFNKKMVRQSLDLLNSRAGEYHLYLNRSCNEFTEKANRACIIAKREFEYLDGIISLMNSIKDFISRHCNDRGIYDEGKIRLRNLVEELSEKAENQLDCFNEFVSEVELSIQDYKECIKNPPQTQIPELRE